MDSGATFENQKPPSSFSVMCVAVIGKNVSGELDHDDALKQIIGQNNPLFIRPFSTRHQELKFHYCCHTACDIIEERVAPGSKNMDLYLGLLYCLEDLAVYGFMTNTKIKFVIVISMTDSSIKDIEMKNLFRRIHNQYIALVNNPFYELESLPKITSKRFHTAIDTMVLG
ncbi:Sedlin, N-terminal conserved region-domain-containing protein [Obelidium mucronatum]|nr:Sedlin, N-terminal conserved region-domain-containing protein [Obelidium mucronatum]